MLDNIALLLILSSFASAEESIPVGQQVGVLLQGFGTRLGMLAWSKLRDIIVQNDSISELWLKIEEFGLTELWPQL